MGVGGTKRVGGVAVFVVGVVAVVGLTACTSGGVGPVSLGTPSSPAATTPAASARAQDQATPSAGRAAAAVPGNAAPHATPQPLTPAGNPLGTINGSVVQTPVDAGPRGMATGTTTKNANGVPETYIVAANDDFNTIAERLSLSPAYLFSLNMVRRADLQLYAGDVLNLDPTHIASVGDENGAVSDLPLPDGAPAQN